MGKYPVSKCLNLPRAAGKEQNERKAEAREVVCDQMTQKAQGVHCTMGNRKREKGRHITIMRAIEDKGKTSMCVRATVTIILLPVGRWGKLRPSMVVIRSTGNKWQSLETHSFTSRIQCLNLRLTMSCKVWEHKAIVNKSIGKESFTVKRSKDAFRFIYEEEEEIGGRHGQPIKTKPEQEGATPKRDQGRQTWSRLVVGGSIYSLGQKTSSNSKELIENT